MKPDIAVNPTPITKKTDPLATPLTAQPRVIVRPNDAKDSDTGAETVNANPSAAIDSPKVAVAIQRFIPIPGWTISEIVLYMRLNRPSFETPVPITAR